MQYGPPDYVGIGVQRAGTSWWHQLISEHPGVYRPKRQPKELHFFDKYSIRGPLKAKAREYGTLFPRPDGALTGEWTPRYLFDYWVPPRLRAAAPDARLLVLLRDPIDRFQSGLTLALANGRRLRREVVEEAFDRGLYLVQLTRLLGCFPRSQVLILQYERCCQDPVTELRRTYEFLGLDPSFGPPSLTRYVHATRGVKVVLTAARRRELRAAYLGECRRLAVAFPDIDLALWPSLSERDND